MAPAVSQKFENFSNRISEEEEQYRAKFRTDKNNTPQCTVCQNASEKMEIYSHPVLHVILCTKCNVNISKTDTISLNLCCWCGLTTASRSCVNCPYKFCKNCLVNNLTRENAQEIFENPNWVCFVCSPSPIWRHRAECSQALTTFGSSNIKSNGNVAEKSQSESTHKRKVVQNNDSSKRLKRSSSLDSKIELIFNDSAKDIKRTTDGIKQKLIEYAQIPVKLFDKVKEQLIEFQNEFGHKVDNPQTCEEARSFLKELLTVVTQNLLALTNEVDNLKNVIKFEEFIKTEAKMNEKRPVLSLKKNGDEDTNDFPECSRANNCNVDSINDDESASNIDTALNLSDISITRGIDDEDTNDFPACSPANNCNTDSVNDEENALNNDATLNSSGISITRGIDDDSDNLSLFSQITEILNHEELAEDIQNADFQQTPSDEFEDEIILCEKTGSFINKRQNINVNADDRNSDLPSNEKDTDILDETLKNNLENDTTLKTSNLLLNDQVSKTPVPESDTTKNVDETACKEQKSDSEHGEKMEFMESLELCKSSPEEQSDDEIVDQALDVLRGFDDDLFDLEINSASISSSESSEEDESDKMNPVNSETSASSKGHKRNLEESNKENEVASNQEILDDNIDRIKPCYVVLKRIDHIRESIVKKSKSPSSVNKELREIENLTNLSNLEKKPQSSTSTKRKAIRKKGKSKKITNNTLSDSDVMDFESEKDVDDEYSLSPTPPLDISLIQPEEIRNELKLVNLQFLKSDSSNKDDDSDSDLEEQNKTKRKNRIKSTDSNKQNKPETAKKESTSIETSKNKWRNDPLLRETLSEDDSDNEKIEGDSVLPMKIKEKLEKQLQKQENGNDSLISAEQTVKFEEIHANNCNSEGATTDVKGHIIIDSSEASDSDIEFISEHKKKKLGRLPIIKNSYSLANNNADTDTDTLSDNSTVGNSKKKGRKNIRAILSDETLMEATKEANSKEKQRKDRLLKKQKDRDCIISESFELSQEEGLVLDLDEETKTAIIIVHRVLTQQLKEHQKAGVRFMWESCYESVERLREDEGSGCILAHCMGLGKTLQVITLIHTLFSHRITNTKHVLIVCPLSIVLNWVKEFQKWLEKLKDNVRIIIKHISDHTAINRKLYTVELWRQQKGVLIMGYEAYERLTKFKDPQNLTNQEINIKKILVDPGPDLVVLDEGHYLRNGKNVRTKALMKIKTKRRIILTGTPLQNNLKEYYYMVNFVKPNLLGSYYEYSNRFVNPITNGQYDDSTPHDCTDMKKRSHVLHKLLRGTVQRYEASELSIYLMEKLDYVLFINLHQVQIRLYEKYIELIKSENNDFKGRLFNNFSTLQHIWTHPYLFFLKGQRKRQKMKIGKEMDVIDLEPNLEGVDNDELPDDWWFYHCPDDYKTNIEYGSKFVVMISIIQECAKVNDKILVFSSSLLELDAIECFIQQKLKWRAKDDYFRLDGSVAPEMRLDLCNSFNSPSNKKLKVFLISHKVGGLGLNLVAANRVILMDVSWNPAYNTQSIFRAYRFGQKKKVYIYRLVSLGTMEEVVYERQVTKLATASRVVDEKQISRHYKSIDLQNTYRQFFTNIDRPAPIKPVDHVLATVLCNNKTIYKYHEHQSLLENLPHEGLNENEMKLAWDEFNKENEQLNKLLEKRKSATTMTTTLDLIQPGPSGVQTFLPCVNANPMVEFMRKFNKSINVPKIIPPTLSSQYKINDAAVPIAPRPETVFIPENRQTFNNFEGTAQYPDVPTFNAAANQRQYQRTNKNVVSNVTVQTRSVDYVVPSTSRAKDVINNPVNLVQSNDCQVTMPKIVSVNGDVSDEEELVILNSDDSLIQTLKQGHNIRNTTSNEVILVPSPFELEQNRALISSLQRNSNLTLSPIVNDNSRRSSAQFASLVSEDIIQID